MELSDYFIFSFSAFVFVIISFITSIYFLKKNKANKPLKLLVIYLGVVVLLEIIASYSVIGYYSNYQYFSFIENSPFRRNTWVYNFYDIINPILIGLYFLYYIENKSFKSIAKITLVLYFLSSVYFQFVTTSFFENSSFVVIAGTFLILGVLFQFFFELLKSDLILQLKTHLPMYIAVGVFVFNVANAPLAIFSDYFNETTGNFLFVKLQVYIVLISNLFMYSCFIIGFLVCSKKMKSF